MPLENHQNITWRCDACGRAHIQYGGPIVSHGVAMLPMLPEGWTRIENETIGQKTFCDIHSLRLEIVTDLPRSPMSYAELKLTPQK